MNIIQVGRPAVSRYHQQPRFFPGGKGVDHTVHDFPVAELGIKLVVLCLGEGKKLYGPGYEVGLNEKIIH